MQISEFFPFWKQLSIEEQSLITSSATRRIVKKGTTVYNGSSDCLGLILVVSGQLRAYINSEEGREITIYRLFDRDTCMFSASCMLQNLQFDITIEAERDSELWIIPPTIFKKLMDTSLPVSNFVNQIIAGRVSEVMWLIEQILWKSFDKRLAAFLLEENELESAETEKSGNKNTTQENTLPAENGDSDIIRITHERIANHLGTAREVVTRMLKYFQNEKLVELKRGSIKILDKEKLEEMAGR